MTTVGKIFVIIVMLMSLTLSGLIVVWYTKSVPYAKAYNDAKDKIAAAYKDAQTSAEQIQRVKAESKNEAIAYAAQVKKLQDDLTARDKFIADKDKELVALRIDKNKVEEVATKLQDESNKRATDVEQMRLTLEKEQKRNNDLLVQTDTLRREKVQADIQANSFRDRNQQLEKQVEQLAKENAKLGTGRGSSLAGSSSTKNPPSEEVTGTVREAEAKGLYKISIGSDAGLARGQTLEAFRVEGGSGKYLGTVRILEVSATEAVCQPMGKMSSPLKVGDKVASRILGSN